MVERRFTRALGSLDSIFRFVDEFLDSRSIDRGLAFDIGLMIEELFTNMLRYHPEGRQDIAIALDADASRITLRMRDHDVDGFDVTALPMMDVAAPLEERRPGGLGIHFVRCIADEFHYSHEGRVSTIVVRKRLVS